MAEPSGIYTAPGAGRSATRFNAAWARAVGRWSFSGGKDLVTYRRLFLAAFLALAWVGCQSGADTSQELEMGRMEQNKEVVRQYVEAFNRGDLDALRTLFTPDAVIQGVLKKGQMDEILPIWRALHEGLAAHLTIDEIIAEGDVVAVRYTERGTFRGAFFGNEPTGKSYELVAMEWFVVRDGKILQRWGARDAASQARQIGLPME